MYKIKTGIIYNYHKNISRIDPKFQKWYIKIYIDKILFDFFNIEKRS